MKFCKKNHELIDTAYSDSESIQREHTARAYKMGCNSSKALEAAAPVKMTLKEFEDKIAEVRRDYRAAEKAVAGASGMMERAERHGNQAMIELVRKTIEENQQALEHLEMTEMQLASKFGMSNWETLGARNRRERGQVRAVMDNARQVSARQLATEAAQAAELNDLVVCFNALRG